MFSASLYVNPMWVLVVLSVVLVVVSVLLVLAF